MCRCVHAHAPTPPCTRPPCAHTPRMHTHTPCYTPTHIIPCTLPCTHTPYAHPLRTHTPMRACTHVHAPPTPRTSTHARARTRTRTLVSGAAAEASRPSRFLPGLRFPPAWVWKAHSAEDSLPSSGTVAPREPPAALPRLVSSGGGRRPLGNGPQRAASPEPRGAQAAARPVAGGSGSGRREAAGRAGAGDRGSGRRDGGGAWRGAPARAAVGVCWRAVGRAAAGTAGT